jgi:hypothetical protein
MRQRAPASRRSERGAARWRSAGRSAADQPPTRAQTPRPAAAAARAAGGCWYTARRGSAVAQRSRSRISCGSWGSPTKRCTRCVSSAHAVACASACRHVAHAARLDQRRPPRAPGCPRRTCGLAPFTHPAAAAAAAWRATLQAVRALRGVTSPNIGFTCQLLQWQVGIPLWIHG